MLADDNRHAVQQPIDVIVQADHGSRWLRFDAPARIVEAWNPEAVPGAVREIEELTRRSGYHAAGFLAYEAGAAFGLDPRPGGGALPLARFTLFDAAHGREVDAPSPSEHFEIGALQPSIAWPEFRATPLVTGAPDV